MDTKVKIMKKINANNCNGMLESSKSLNIATNPFMQNLSSFSAKELEMFLGQYCHFPRHIISILVSACYTMGYYKWNDVVLEIRENISSELGDDYDDIAYKMPPHYSMLRMAIEEGFEMDINDIQIQKATNFFVHSLDKYMNAPPANTAGAIYALEATAINELRIVCNITEYLFVQKNSIMPDLLKNFFEVHITDIEIKHRDRLFNVINQYIEDDTNAEEFYSGFKFTLDLMDKWWEDLYKEIKENMKDD